MNTRGSGGNLGEIELSCVSLYRQQNCTPPSILLYEKLKKSQNKQGQDPVALTASQCLWASVSSSGKGKKILVIPPSLAPEQAGKVPTTAGLGQVSMNQSPGIRLVAPHQGGQSPISEKGGILSLRKEPELTHLCLISCL